jgi:hypothetical protein
MRHVTAIVSAMVLRATDWQTNPRQLTRRKITITFARKPTRHTHGSLLQLSRR